MLTESSLRTYDKCFSFHLKSSFHSISRININYKFVTFWIYLEENTSKFYQMLSMLGIIYIYIYIYIYYIYIYIYSYNIMHVYNA